MIEHRTPDTDGSALLGILSQWRKRCRTVTIVANTLSAVMVLLGIVVPLLVSPVPWWIRQTGLPLAVIAIVVVVMAIVHASARTPTIREMAALVDLRLGLSDSLITAVECAGSSDLVAQLVVRDALRAAVRLSSRRLFPLRPPGRPAVLATIALAMIISVVSLAVIPRPSESGRRGSPATLGADGEPVAAGSGRPANRNDAAGSTVPAAHAGDRDASATVNPQGGSHSAASGVVSAPVTAAGRQSEHAEHSFAARDSNSASPSRRRDTGSSRGSGGMPSTASGPSTLPRKGVQSSSNRGGLGDGGATSSSGAGGGVSSGPLPLHHRASRGHGGFTAGGTEGEAAVTNDPIPAGLARYVKAYFAAIQTR